MATMIKLAQYFTEKWGKAPSFSVFALSAFTVLAGVCGPTPVFAQEDCSGSINYEDADIRSVVDEIAIRTGRKFVLDPRVQGRVTIKSPPEQSLCAGEIWELFQTSLRVNGYLAVPINGGSYKIVPSQEGPRSAGPVGEGQAGDLVTQIVKLTYLDAREAAANLTQIINERGVVAPVRSGNALVLVDTSENIRRLREVLKEIDRDNRVYKSIALENVSAMEVSRVVSEMAKEMSDESSARISVVPVEASNSLLVRAAPAQLVRLNEVIRDLDRLSEARGDLSVVFLRHADAELMADKIKEFMNQSSGGEAGAGNARATVTAYKPTNAIIINGDANTQSMLKSVITQLDVRQAQVMVEAIIVDISESTARELGIQYFVTGDGQNSAVPFSTTNFTDAQPNILAAAGATLLSRNQDFLSTNSDSDGDSDNNSSLTDTLAETALTSLLGINGFALGGAGQGSNGTVFGGILTAIKQDSDSNILSAPFTTTLDNQPATLSSGQEIPITTGEQVGDDFTNAFRTVSREEVGIILEVTPHINDGGTVTLEVAQEISSVAGQIISSSTDLITNKSKITTTALVDDGDILVIGGLIDQSKEVFEDKVPLLGDVPVFGNLFKTSAQANRRRNLMVFIRPTIIRQRQDASKATYRKFDYIRARDVLNNGAPESAIESLIEEVSGMGRAPYRYTDSDLENIPAAPEPLLEAGE